MRSKKTLAWGVLLCLSAAGAAIAAGLGVEEKVAIEKTLTDKIQQIAVPFLGSEKFLVWADVTLNLAVKNISKSEPEPSPKFKEIEKTDDSLPGVDEQFIPEELRTKINPALLGSRPIIQNLENTMQLPKDYIAKVRVVMKVPTTTPPERIAELKKALEKMIPISDTRGDELSIDAMAFYMDPMEKLIYYKNEFGTAAFWGMAILIMTIFLFGPTRIFLDRMAGTLENFEIKTTGSMKELIEQKGGGAAALAGGPAGLLGGPEAKKVDDSIPFSFVNALNLTKVLWTLEGADAPTISVVAAHLAPDLSSQLIAQLEPEKQKEVLLLLASPQSVEKDIITQLHQQLKVQVESVVGGVDHILMILDQQSPDKQQVLLEELRADKPDIVQKIEGRLLTLDKVFKLEKAGLQGLLWEAYRQRITLGVILKTLPKEQQQTGLSALPETLTRVVADEMNLPTSKAQTETELRKFMTLVRNLEKTGKVTFPAAKA